MDIKFENHTEHTSDKQFCDIVATCNECKAELNIAYKFTYVSEE